MSSTFVSYAFNFGLNVTVAFIKHHHFRCVCVRSGFSSCEDYSTKDFQITLCDTCTIELAPSTACNIKRSIENKLKKTSGWVTSPF